MHNRWRGLAVALMVIMALIALMACKADPAPTPTPAPVAETTAQPTEAPKQDADTDEPDEETPEAVTYSQSPFLDGKGLPPVEERLPKNPKISNSMPPSLLTYQIGRYGGTFRTPRTSPDTDTIVFIINNQPLINTPGLLGEEITPNILEDFQVNEGNNEFTFRLREGLRWSDGVPVTMDDVKFAIEDFQFHDELSPAGVGAWLREQGQPGADPMTFEVVDDWTFKLKFKESYGGFLLSMAVEGWRGYTDLLKPKHYLKQFHTKYTPLADLEPLIAEKGFEPGEWVNLFNERDVISTEVDKPQAVDMPQLTPWIMVEFGDITFYERNPYHYKVDPAGQQLPYFDRVQSTFVNDVEMVNLKLLSGEADHSYEWAVMSKVSMYKDSEATSGLKTYTHTTLHRTANNLILNLTNEDPTWRSAVHNADFRKAVNMCIDRNEIVDTVFLGFAKPYEKQDVYDPEQSKKILDDIGMTVGSNGKRTAPDGKRLLVSIEYGMNASFDTVPQAELVASYLESIGIDVIAKEISGSLLGQRRDANETYGDMVGMPGPVMWFRPEWNSQIWMPLWHRWCNTQGAAGEEPPAEAQEFMRLLNAIRPAGFNQARGVWDQLVDNHATNNWFFLHTQEVVQPVALRATIMNFEDQGMAIANNYAAEQWWFDE